MRTIRPAALAAAGLFLLGLHARAAQPDLPTPPAPTSTLFGLNGVSFFHYRNAPDAHDTAQKRMDALKRAGADWDRFDLWWGEMEPTRGVWKWASADWLVGFYARNHVQTMPILSYRAAWMTQPPHTPQDRAEFAEYVRRVVGRYKAHIHCWEVWNEPNIPTFWPAPNAADYTALLKAAYTAAHQADPHCTIVGASANEADINWLRAIARNGGLPFMDAVSIHPYSMADGPDQMDLARQLENVRATLAAFGRPHLPIWITEMGWTSSVEDPSAQERNNAYLVQSYVIAAAQGVPHLFWFNLQDWNEGGKLQGWGLISPDYRLKTTLTAYRRLADALRGATSRGYASLPGGLGYAFGRGSDRTLIAWADRGRHPGLPVGTAARVSDVQGRSVPAPGGQITLTASPVFVANPPRALWAKLSPMRPVPKADNLVVNGSLGEADDKGAYGWHKGVFYGGGDKGMFGVAIEPGGGHSLSLTNAPDALWESWPVPALPGETYTLTAQVKTTNATGENGVQILFLSGPGWGWKGGPTSATVTGTGDWKTVMVSGTVPDDADVVRVNLVSKKNTGTVQFRDIRLTRRR